MEVKEDLATLLDTYMKRATVGDARLATQVNSIADNPHFIHRSTIRNWRKGSSRKITNWRQLVTVAAALSLNESETNELLGIGGCPTLSALSVSARDSDKRLFNHWFGNPMRDNSQLTQNLNGSANEPASLAIRATETNISTGMPRTLSWRTLVIVGAALFIPVILLFQYNKVTNMSGNMLLNSDFSDSSVGWQSYVNDAAAARFEVVQEAMRIHIEQPSNKGWHIGLFQTIASVQAGETYTFRYRVRGNGVSNMKSDVTRAVDPKTTLGFNDSIRQSVHITDKWAIQTFEFEANQNTTSSDGGGRVVFEFGTSNPGWVEIDDVEFFKGKIKPAS